LSVHHHRNAQLELLDHTAAKAAKRRHHVMRLSQERRPNLRKSLDNLGDDVKFFPSISASRRSAVSEKV
jgi:hypothetical protein